MIGLVLKDLLVLRKTIKVYLAMLVFYLVLTATGAFDNNMLTGFVTLFTMMLPISSFAYDELARWDKYAAALPLSRRQIVASKYLLAIMLGLVAEVLIAVMAVILTIVKDADPGEMLLAGLVCMAIGIVLNCILLPFLFQFGAEKGRLFMMVVFAAIFLLGFALVKLIGEGAMVTALTRWEAILPVASTAVVLLALLVSIPISMRIYSKKEL